MEKIIIEHEEGKKATNEEILSKLLTSNKGLTSQEVTSRIAIYGANEITEKKVNIIIKFFGYFYGPIPFMIEIAAILSAGIHHWDDFYIILTMLLINAFVGFFQEHKAENAIDLLKEKLTVSARVFRDKKWLHVAAKELVPGDIVRIRPGDSVPADLKLIKGEYIMVDESALTGESLPVEKHLGDTLYASSIIRQGEMDACCYATGMDTFFGKTAKLVSEAKTQSHLQKAVFKIGNFLILIAIFLVIVIFIAAIMRHESLMETLQFALVLTVAAIPVALPAVLSVTMVVGATALAKKEAIVSKLISIEEMASMDILCSDKTGTITKNELTVAEVIALDGYSEADVLLYGSLASREENKDAIDNAIITEANKTCVLDNNQYEVLDFIPFDAINKRTQAEIIDNEGHTSKISKGAPQRIMDLANNTQDISSYVDNFAYKGHRPLAIAKTDSNHEWKIIGLIALYDPAREDSSETIKMAKEMGVEVKMITGDHTAIAKQTAKQVNLGTNIVKAATFLDKSEILAQQIVKDADGFAEVYPEHKYRIVELLQNKGHIVGMTGDGVNDAPALKKADVGIAVAGATDAAKGASDIVLTRPGLSVIIDAIIESRKIFERMTNYSIYRIAETIRILIFTTLAILVFRIYPVTALMIVLLALFNDGPIMTIAYDHVNYSKLPTRWNLKHLLTIASFLGFIGVTESFFMLYIAKDIFHLGQDMIQSFIYLKLSVAGQLTIFLARTKGPFYSVKPSKPLLIAVVATQTLAILNVVYGFLLPAALGWGYALFIIVEVIIVFLITDFLKVRLYKFLDRNKAETKEEKGISHKVAYNK